MVAGVPLDCRSRRALLDPPEQSRIVELPQRLLAFLPGPGLLQRPALLEGGDVLLDLIVVATDVRGDVVSSPSGTRGEGVRFDFVQRGKQGRQFNRQRRRLRSSRSPFDERLYPVFAPRLTTNRLGRIGGIEPYVESVRQPGYSGFGDLDGSAGRCAADPMEVEELIQQAASNPELSDCFRLIADVPTRSLAEEASA